MNLIKYPKSIGFLNLVCLFSAFKLIGDMNNFVQTLTILVIKTNKKFRNARARDIL